MFNLVDKAYDLVYYVRYITQKSLTKVFLNGIWVINVSKDRGLSKKLHMMAKMYDHLLRLHLAKNS